MSVRIRIGDSEATIDRYRWVSEDATLLRLLEAVLDPYGQSPSIPNPDLMAAEAAVAELGGEILEVIEPEGAHVEGRIY